MNMGRRRTDRKVDWFRVAVILGLGILLVIAFMALGKVKGSWIIPSASAAEATLSWEAPTKNCNGTPLTDLTGYDMTYGQKRTALPLTPLSKTVTGLTPGTWWFSLAAVTPTARSEFVTVEKTVTPAEFVTTATTVYTALKKTNAFALAPVGTIALGVVCDPTQSVNGHYVIPRTSVAWSGNIKPSVVVAKCD
jgi:hypothetical protein